MDATATDTNPSEAQTETPVVEGETPAPEPQTQTQPEAFDPGKIDPKARDYFEKEYSTKYQDYEASKKAAAELRLFQNDPEFNKWLVSRNQPQAPKPFEITDEQFTAALTDPKQFAKLVQDAAKHLHEQEVAPKFAEQEYRTQVEAKTTELSKTVAKFPDFKDLDKRGLIAPLIQKYPPVGRPGTPEYRPGISFEEAYWIAKQNTFSEDVAKAARGQVNSRKGATVEKGDNAPSKTSTVTKVADRAELMERVAEDVRAGREPGSYDYD